jgi:hypothetical protein
MDRTDGERQDPKCGHPTPRDATIMVTGTKNV